MLDEGGGVSCQGPIEGPVEGLPNEHQVVKGPVCGVGSMTCLGMLHSYAVAEEMGEPG